MDCFKHGESHGIPSCRAEIQTSQLLPAYMVPLAYVPINRMPLSASGKLDRGKLSDLASQLSIHQLTSYGRPQGRKHAPSTNMEKIIRKLWAKTFNINPDEIGVHNDFLRLGGDSVSAMRLVITAREEGIILTVTDVFRSKNLSEMSQMANNLGVRADEDVDLAPFATLGKTETTECNKRLYRKYISMHTIAGSLMALSMTQPGAYVAQHVFTCPATLNVDRFRAAWAATIDSNPIPRTRIIQSGQSKMFQVVLRGSPDWYHPGDFDSYIEKDRQTPISFGRPQTRYALISDASTKKHRMVWKAHHAIYDGWSLPLIMRHIEGAYIGTIVGRPADFSRFIEHTANVDSHATAEYWRSQLSDMDLTHFPAIRRLHISR